MTHTQTIREAARKMVSRLMDQDEELIESTVEWRDFEKQLADLERQQEPPATRLSEEEIEAVAQDLYPVANPTNYDACDGPMEGKHWAVVVGLRRAGAMFTTPKEVRGLSVEQGKDLLRAINAGAWERIHGALRVNAVSQEHVTQCFKDLGIELEPPF